MRYAVVNPHCIAYSASLDGRVGTVARAPYKLGRNKLLILSENEQKNAAATARRHVVEAHATRDST
jgi:tRNA C32,U32 (ribose-2'-O)-methylase TrmJ